VPNENRHSVSLRVSSLVGSLLLVCAACSVDNRQLELAAAGAGSAGVGGAAQVAGASHVGGSLVTAGMSGDAGAVDVPIPVFDGGADLDTNKIADFRETSVKNPDFERDVAAWLPGIETTVEWNEQNAAGDLPSGSALVASVGIIDPNGAAVALRAVQQCIPISGSKLVIVYANAWVDPGQDEQGRAELDVAFFDSEDCSGSLSTTFSTPQPLAGGVGSWLTLKAGSVSGASTKSAQIKLALLKPFRAESFQARFDNVLVKVENTQP